MSGDVMDPNTEGLFFGTSERRWRQIQNRGGTIHGPVRLATYEVATARAEDVAVNDDSEPIVLRVPPPFERADVGCGGCPFFRSQHPLFCNAHEQQPPRPYASAPYWCPLRPENGGVVTVRGRRGS